MRDLIRRGVVSAISNDGSLQIDYGDGELRDGVVLLTPPGFAVAVEVGCSVLVLKLWGSRLRGVAVACWPAKTAPDLERGDAALFAKGAFVVCRKEGTVEIHAKRVEVIAESVVLGGDGGAALVTEHGLVALQSAISAAAGGVPPSAPLSEIPGVLTESVVAR
jgi:phage gp45-like